MGRGHQNVSFPGRLGRLPVRMHRQRVLYFGFDDDRPVLFGHLAVVYGLTPYPPILPDWWFEARENVILYYGFKRWGWA